MSKTISITATKRDTFGSANARRMRRAGLIPAVMYGHGKEAASITVTPAEAALILNHTGLVELNFDGGAKQLAVVKDVQTNPLSLATMHIDFLEVRADEVVTATVPVEHEGDPKGVQAGGMLQQELLQLEVSAVPTALPDVIKVDVSGLELDGVILVKDLVLPEGVKAVAHAEQVVFQCKIPRRAAAEAAAAEAAAAAAPAAEEKK